MKRIIKRIFVLLIMLILFGCRIDTTELIDNKYYEMVVGDVLMLEFKDEVSFEEVNYSIDDPEIIFIKNGVVTALKHGETTVKATAKKDDINYESTISFKVSKKTLSLFSIEEYESCVDEKIMLYPTGNIQVDDINYEIKNQGIISIENGIVTATKDGETLVETSYEDETYIYKSVLKFIINKKEESLFEKNSYEVMMKETLLLDPIAGIDIKDIQFKIADENIVKIENGLVTPINIGSTLVSVETEKVKSTILIIVIPYRITVNDVETNALIYSEFNEKIIQYEEKMNNIEYLQYTTNINIYGQSVSQKIKLKKDQIYIESYEESKNQTTIIKEINDRVYKFESHEDYPNAYMLDYLAEADEYNYDNNLITLFKLNFPIDKGNITKDGNKYIMEIYLSDCLDEEEKELWEELATSVGIDVNDILSLIYNITYTFEGNDLNVNVQTDFSSINIGSEMKDLEVSISFNYSLNDFEMFDEDNPDYFIEAPTSYYEIYKVTDILNEGIDFSKHFSSEHKLYLKFYLDAGYYYMDDENTTCSIFMKEILDEEMNHVEFMHEEVMQSDYLRYMNNAFYIPEDGCYYMCIFPDVYSSQLFYKVNRLNYETSPFEVIKDNPIEMEGLVEGYGDIDYYTFTNNTDRSKIIKIKNEGDTTVYISSSRYGDNQFMNEELLVDNYRYYLVRPGLNKILITHKYIIWDEYDNPELPYAYSLKVEEVNYEYGIGQDGKNLEKMTTELSQRYYMVGYGLDDSYMTIEVKEYGYYIFAPEFIEEKMSVQSSVYNSDGNNIYTGITNEYILEPGVYSVRLTNNDHIFGIFRIKYIFKSLEDIEVEVDIPVADFNGGDINLIDIFTIQNQKVTRDHKVRYSFELEETTTIIYSAKDVYIYEYNTNKQISISGNNVGVFYLVITLKPGKYYIETPTMHGRVNLKVKVAILLSYEDDNKNDYYAPIILKENEKMTFNKEWIHDNEIVKIVIEEKCNINISYLSISVFDYDYQYILGTIIMDSNTIQYSLEPGEYYLLIKYDGNTSLDITYSK